LLYLETPVLRANTPREKTALTRQATRTSDGQIEFPVAFWYCGKAAAHSALTSR